MAGSAWVWSVVVIVLIAVAMLAFLISASLQANRRSQDSAPARGDLMPGPRAPAAAPADDSWTQAMRAAAAATPEVSTSQRQVLSRDALVNPDRTLNPNLWDNAPDGSEQDDDDDDTGAVGRTRGDGGGLDAGFFDALRAKRDGGGDG